MRTVLSRQIAHRDLRRQVDRLEGLPLRPATARFVLDELPEEIDDASFEVIETTRWRSLTSLDPGWVLEASRGRRPNESLDVVASRPWWPATSREGADALLRLWRHSTAVSLAARRLAREANDPDPDALGQAGLLNGLALWAVSAIDPEWLANWLQISDPQARRELEHNEFGAGIDTLGRNLAERWRAEPLVVDAAWLLGEFDLGLSGASTQPSRLELLQQAYALAEKTPWSLSSLDVREHLSHDPRVKLLIAEVQSRCGSLFAEPDISPREEAFARSTARLRIRVAGLLAGQSSRDRLLTAIAESNPTETPEDWAERASLAWCGESGVSASRVVWQDPEKITHREPVRPVESAASSTIDRPPSIVIPLAVKGRTLAEVQLWTETGAPLLLTLPDQIMPAWSAWAEHVADRGRTQRRLSEVVNAYRHNKASEELHVRNSKLTALAEFAAGAGHEMNNPLAVVVGRAQLLLVGETDPKTIRSLRAILTQAQRAHRILRDLMYVARPPEPRPRFCSPDEVVRASLRDARSEADDLEVRIVSDALEHGTRAWADPDGLRHLADSLIRNALEATPRGGLVRFTTGGDKASLRWTIQDTGRGITPEDGLHLFDPFYCGRQAGRGLGMGLPRAARFVKQLGGEIRWQATPGQGSTFHVRLPLTEPPKPMM